MIKPIILLLLLLAPLLRADPPAGPTLRRLTLPFIAEAERADTILQKGQPAYLETDPSVLFIGDGQTPGGIRVSPPTSQWDHNATQDIRLNGYRLHLGNGYSLLTLGAYSALSGDGELQDSPGQSQWSVNAVALIRLQAGELLTSIDSFTWHPNDGANGQFELTINVGASAVVPTLQAATDLIAQDWQDITPASMSEPDNGLRTARIDYDGQSNLLFFRAVLPAQAPEIDLLANTTITGDLTVTGSIPRADDIDLGVEAHTWGDHAAAGYLTSLPPTATTAEAEAGTLDELRSWTPERIAEAILALSPPTPQTHATITSVTVDANTAITPVMDGDVFVTTHEGDFTLTINDPADATRAIRTVIETRQDATGGRTVTWAGNLSTPGAVTPPALTTTANAVDVWTWQWTGTRWRLVGVTFGQEDL